MIKLIIVVALGAGIGAVMGYFGKCESGQCPLTANPFRGALFGALIAAAVILPSMFRKEVSETHSDSLIQIQSEADFKTRVLESPLPSLVDFYADWCGPCRSLSPTINSLADKYMGRANVAKVNVDANKDLAGKYGVQGIPCVLLISGGKEVARLVGARDSSDYEKALESCMENPEKDKK